MKKSKVSSLLTDAVDNAARIENQRIRWTRHHRGRYYQSDNRMKSCLNNKAKHIQSLDTKSERG